jgi:aryl-alcohol dehydrogenase-like predicted oxidoreductase
MEQVSLGETGRTVSRIGLGAMPLSLKGRPDREAAKAVVRRAVELGVTLIDTADAYCLDDSETGHNERLVAEALSELGVAFGGRGGGSPEVVVATKGGMVRPGGRWARSGHPDHLRAACEASLRALGAERIDLYQFHSPDPRVPFTDSVGSLARLRDEGKIAAIGLSNVTVSQIREAQALVRVDSVQNRLGPWDVSFRKPPVVEYCREQGITFLPYSPVGGGGRVGLVRESEPLRRIGREVGCSPEELVLAWILRLGPHVVPIPGASRPESIESSVRAEGLALDPRTARRVRRAFGKLPGAVGPVRWLVRGVLRRVKRYFP